jgi:hypothetical protein
MSFFYSDLFGSSPKYKEDLAKSKSEKKFARVETTETFMPDDVTLTDSNSNWGVVNMDRVEDGTADSHTRVFSRAPSQYCEALSR